MQFYKISEFAKLIGVTPVTLRSWEKSNILVPHHRSPTGYRYYSEKQLSDYINRGSKNEDNIQ